MIRKPRKYQLRPAPATSTTVIVDQWQAQPQAIAIKRNLQHYPVSSFPLLSSLDYQLDPTGVLCTLPFESASIIYHPTQIAQFALLQWNAYLSAGDYKYEQLFMAQACWLRDHQALFFGTLGGWLIRSLPPRQQERTLLLSSITQGCSISVLLRAYQLTSNIAFLHSAQRAAQTLKLDILDGGVHAPVGEQGIFFEALAAYPATHRLSGHLLALLGLYDYAIITKNKLVEPLLQSGLTALELLLPSFDAGFWTYDNLLCKRLASRDNHQLHIELLDAIATYADRPEYAVIAARWKRYQTSVGCRLQHRIKNFIFHFYDHSLKPLLQHMIYPQTLASNHSMLKQICVPVRAFPAAGGVKSVLTEVAEAMEKQWQLIYLTDREGQKTDGTEIIVFGQRSLTSPWQFPNLWLYCFVGAKKLFTLLRSKQNVQLILPQDGLYTAAFAALIARLMDIPVVCMDHGTITCLVNPTFRAEWTKAIASFPWYKKTLARLRLISYWPSLRLLAQLGTACSDHLLIAGDEVEQVYRKELKAPPEHITRYTYNVDLQRFTPPDQEVIARMRTEQKIPADAIVITLINRLALEKGLSFAIEGIAIALAGLAPQLRQRMRVLIVGEGPLQSQLEAGISYYKLTDVCTMWGNAELSDVVMLLAISDIFLYSGTRGTNYSMAVLEAMAAGCAVIASTAPLSNARLLAEGRGIPIPPANAQEIGSALALLCNNQQLRQQMGQRARIYIAARHNSTLLKRTLLRVSSFTPSYI